MSCCAGNPGKPCCLFSAGDEPPFSQRFEVPEGGWAMIYVDGLPEGERLCVYQVICVCGKPEMVQPLCLGTGGHIGIKDCGTQAAIPIGGTFFLEYSGADIDFDVLMVPYASVETLALLTAGCGG